MYANYHHGCATLLDWQTLLVSNYTLDLPYASVHSYRLQSDGTAKPVSYHQFTYHTDKVPDRQDIAHAHCALYAPGWNLVSRFDFCKIKLSP